MAIVDEFGPQEMLRRLSDPWWFQAFGCVLGFDWHSSGVTTVTCGALKEAYKQCGAEMGIVVAGGKGAASRKTPQEIAQAADDYSINAGDQLVYASRMSAKVDSAAVQDSYQLYHHTFVLVPDGGWCVIQQGMNEDAGWARRYHWHGESVDDFVCEPHTAVQDLSPNQHKKPHTRQLTLLNMVAKEADENRSGSTRLINENPDWLLDQIQQATEGPTLFAPARHRVLMEDINTKRLKKIIVDAHEQHPNNFESLLGTKGVGPATIRSLSLLAELIYEAPASRRNPTVLGRSPIDTSTRSTDDDSTRRWADYSYAHGGKDGTPFPVDRSTYDQNINVLTEAIRRARVGENEKVEALKRLASHSQ